ncbi:MAG: tetratricopeptide repeat protein [Kiritimatiellae bacterium]|nr:tetratricopeptide repeat protein [Kiritimatiellia bacterium]
MNTVTSNIARRSFFLIVFMLSLVVLQTRAQEDLPIEISEDDLLEEMDISVDDLNVDDLIPEPEAPAVLSINDDPADLKNATLFLEEPEESDVWTGDEDDMATIDDATNLGPGAPPKKPGGGIDVTAYADLLGENIDLRKDMNAFAEESRMLSQEIVGLKKLAKSSDDQLAESIRVIQDLKREQGPAKAGSTPAVPAPSDGKELEAARRALTEALEKASMLENEFAALSAANERLKKQVSTAATGAGGTPGPAVSGVAGPKPGSDLYQAMEQESFKLKDQVKAVETERDALAQKVAALEAEKTTLVETGEGAAAREQALRTEVAEALSGQEAYQTSMANMLEKVPSLEQELAQMKSAGDSKDVTIRSKERELKTLRQELERRELRIIKAERMAELLEKTRTDVRKASENEKRDMHFNMAVVYVKEANYRAAEKEYLHALRIDPTDADTHYNLAILYDDHMVDPRRAARHYRSYLKLAPNSEDVDRVKTWLVALEIRH